MLGEFAPPDVWQPAWLETLQLFEELVRRDPTNIDHRMVLGECQYDLGCDLLQHGRDAEAGEHLRRSRQIWQGSREALCTRLEAAPSDRSLKQRLCQCELLLGQLGCLPEMAAEAIAALHGLTRLLRTYIRRSPNNGNPLVSWV